MSNPVSKALRLRPIDWWLFACAIVLLPIVGVLLKHKGLKKTERLLSRRISEPRSGNNRLVSQAATAVTRASLYGLSGGKCLEQAFTLWWMLAILGVDSNIRFGVYKNEAEFEAHAWVESDNQIVIGEQDSARRFEPLPEVKIGRHQP